MSRPFKCRRISCLPPVTVFKPAGIPLRELEVVNLSFEEVEAIRLKELEGLEQGQAAEKMNISRPTYQRILISARRKLADVLLSGKAIRIAGGNFEIYPRRFRCLNGHEWNVSPEETESTPLVKCPICEMPDISAVSLPETVGSRRKGQCRREPGKLKSSLPLEESSDVSQTDIGNKMLTPDRGG
jgi:uncharacterized protein